MDIRKVTLNDLHESLGAKMVPFAGYNMPVRYTSDIEEHMTVRNGVGVFDVSHMGEFFLKGEKALDLIQRVTSNDASKLVDEQAQYSCLPNEDGGIVDDLIVYKIDETNYMLVVNASNIEKDWNWIKQYNTEGVEMINASDDYSLLAIQGPKAVDVLQRLTTIELGDIKFYHFTIGTFAGHDDVILSNTGYTGSGGFEIYVKNDIALDVWNKIFEAGRSENIQPIGLGARDTLRLEKGYCLYGNDINNTTSPLEAGLGWITKFSKTFTNSENLLKQKEAGISKKLVGFVITEKGIPRNGYVIENENSEEIGVVTSGTISPMLQKGIGMGYVQLPYAAEGSKIFIAVRNKKIPANVIKMPFV
jgi:aminomethyltransferase